jgi:hypothetical protein
MRVFLKPPRTSNEHTGHLKPFFSPKGALTRFSYAHFCFSTAKCSQILEFAFGPAVLLTALDPRQGGPYSAEPHTMQNEPIAYIE